MLFSYWYFCEEINNLIISVLKSTEYDILVLTDLETICDICLKFSLFLHYFCALLNKELSSGNSICQNLPHGHDIGKLDFILTLHEIIWYNTKLSLGFPWNGIWPKSSSTGQHFDVAKLCHMQAYGGVEGKWNSWSSLIMKKLTTDVQLPNVIKSSLP